MVRLLDGLQAAKKIVQMTVVLPKGISLVINKEGVTSIVNSITVSETPAEVSHRIILLMIECRTV